MLEDRKRLKEIEAIRDEDIDYSDIPATDAAFWADAELRMPECKKHKAPVARPGSIVCLRQHSST